ncbi:MULTISPECIES: CFI-box-CTERM domain-containing protein [Kamptonema]|uniref:CFI-box-CTERM domain-containing protein n=1 Tax=Kamptonema TaxID=1501433 RepID=UPI0001DACCA0|nr:MULTISPECIES: CFI-box-CTERM domain-containing protein [Kamptonema]CBN57554.1 hypothetical protein OSCI_3460076 [Kamptonema sp. PCC 6506]
MERLIYRMVEEAEKNATRYYERAEYYENQGDSNQALANYVDSLRYHAEYTDYNEKAYKQRWIDGVLESGTANSGDSIYYEIENQVEFFLNLSIRLACIVNHYNDDRDELKKAYLAEKQKLIFDAVSVHRRVFNVKQIKLYDSLSEHVRVTSNIINRNKEALEKIKKVSPEQESDATFKKIRVALLKISETKIPLVALEEKPGSFIATAAYSTSKHPDIDTFRNFRDKKLLTNPVGQGLVSLYYNISPSIANYVKRQPVIKSFLRQQLERLAEWMRSQGMKS